MGPRSGLEELRSEAKCLPFQWRGWECAHPRGQGGWRSALEQQTCKVGVRVGVGMGVDLGVPLLLGERHSLGEGGGKGIA